MEVLRAMKDIVTGDFNRSTLSGAIDIIAVEMENGDIISTPFHVRFGKLQILRSRDKKVIIRVNGKKVPLAMKLGAAGAAFFVAESTEEPSDSLATSPLSSPTNKEMAEFGGKILPPTDKFRLDRPANTTDGASMRKQRSFSSRPRSWSEEDAFSGIAANANRDDGSLTPPLIQYVNTRCISRDGTKDRKRDALPTCLNDPVSPKNWHWGSLPSSGRFRSGHHGAPFSSSETKTTRKRTLWVTRGSVYEVELSDVQAGQFVAWNFSTDRYDIGFSVVQKFVNDKNDLRPRVVIPPRRVSCECNSESGGVVVTTACILVLRFDNSYSSIRSKRLTYNVHYARHQQLPRNVRPRVRTRFGEGVIVRCDRTEMSNAIVRIELDNGPLLSLICGSDVSSARNVIELVPIDNVSYAAAFRFDSSTNEWTRLEAVERAIALSSPRLQGIAKPSNLVTASSRSPGGTNRSSRSRSSGYFSWIWSEPDDEGVAKSDNAATSSSSSSSSRTMFYLKSLRPTSAQLRSFDLRPGQNSITFEVTSSLQGTRIVRASVYLWSERTRLVISDVDGTITRSDAMGHLMYLVNRDWTHDSVCRLFSSIKNNGYRIVYLTSRPIGLVGSTKHYLYHVRQGDACLPQGPIITSPSRMLKAIHREVVSKSPQTFKIAALRDIRALFPSDVNPFYAGFGNRATDVESYLIAGFPRARIFCINPEGNVFNENHTYKKSYEALLEMVDFMFPSYNEEKNALISSIRLGRREDVEDAFSDLNFWKRPSTDMMTSSSSDDDDNDGADDDDDNDNSSRFGFRGV